MTESMVWKPNVSPNLQSNRAERIVAWINAHGGEAELNDFRDGSDNLITQSIVIRTADGYTFANPGDEIFKTENTFEVQVFESTSDETSATKALRVFYARTPKEEPEKPVLLMRPKGGIEQARRNLMMSDPALYQYIEALVAARELNRAGGDASGAIDNYGAANRVWELSARWVKKRDEIRKRDANDNQDRL